MDFDLIEEDQRWSEVPLHQLVESASGGIVELLKIDSELSLSVLAGNDARIAKLNQDFRGKAAATNVLSWPTEDLIPPALPDADPDGVIEIGDIALAYEACAREAVEQGKDLADHVLHLIVHGILHLLGYDHDSDAEATVMETLETRILGKLGLPDPYMTDSAPRKSGPHY